MNSRTIPTKTIYLEMDSPPAALSDSCLPKSMRVRRVERPSPGDYRVWYRRVGQDYLWVDRLLMPDADLQRIIHHPDVDIHLLSVDDRAAGYSELDRRDGRSIELAYFGLFPEFVGQGWGRRFLEWTIRQAWSHAPQRVWLHTCDLDHPAALPNYVKAGFRIYDEKMVDQIVPDSID